MKSYPKLVLAKTNLSCVRSFDLAALLGSQASPLKVAPCCFLTNGGKNKFQLQKVLMGISEKNEIKAMHKITFRASNSVNG